MASTIALLGVDYRFASLEVREQLSFSSRDQQELLPSLIGPEVAGALLLSTCNRTELYLSITNSDKREVAIGGALATLQRFRPHAALLCEESIHTMEWDDQAVFHLFRVAAGIDSQIMGDTNIVQQIKQAHQNAAATGTLCTLLDRMVTESLRAGKRARRETAIGRGAASVGAAVLRSVRALFEDLSRVRVLILGGGEACQEVARQISKVRLGDVTFSSRTPEQAIVLARSFGGRTLDWSAVPARLPTMDVIVAATSARLPFLGPAQFEQKRCAQANPLLIVDVGVPRNADPQLGRVEGVRLVDLDGLTREEGEARMRRALEVPRVEAILTDEMHRWRTWRKRWQAGRESAAPVRAAIHEASRLQLSLS
jgi:glutamyl-tRNA reductase